jgi:hypothetical protein
VRHKLAQAGRPVASARKGKPVEAWAFRLAKKHPTNKGLPAPVGRFQAVALALTHEATQERSKVERHPAPAKGEPRPRGRETGGSVTLFTLRNEGQALEKSTG